MKLYKILPVALLALSSTLFQSCLKDQVDYFEQSPSERMQAKLDEARKVLTSSPEGWVFEYFPDSKISYGGYVYTVKFDDEMATVGCELAPGEFESSYYKFNNDNGPMLSFDTYNTLMHYFATPSSGQYQAQDGDFEFMIMDIKDDVVKLRGKRTGNTMYMRRLTVPAEEYLAQVSSMIDNMIITSAKGTIAGQSVDININSNKRYMEFTFSDDTQAGGYYLPTPTGIAFTEPVDIKGTELSVLAYDAETLTYSGDGISFTGEVAPDFGFFSEFEGEFTIKYNGSKTIKVTLERDIPAKKVIFKGLNPNFDIIGNYDSAKGYVNIVSQQVGSEDGLLFWLCAWALDPATGTGSVTWSTDAGMYLVKDPENPGTYNFVNNGNSSYNITSFNMYYFTGSVGGQPRGNCNGKTKWYINGTYQMTYLSTMVKN